MPNINAISNITSGLNAALKLRDLTKQQTGNNQRFSLSKSTPEMLSEMIKTVAEHNPSGYNRISGVHGTVDMTSVYLSAYRELKLHLENSKSRSPKSSDMLGIMNSVKTIVPVKQQQLIEKIIKISEIINS